MKIIKAINMTKKYHHISDIKYIDNIFDYIPEVTNYPDFWEKTHQSYDAVLSDWINFKRAKYHLENGDMILFEIL